MCVTSLAVGRGWLDRVWIAPSDMHARPRARVLRKGASPTRRCAPMLNALCLPEEASDAQCPRALCDLRAGGAARGGLAVCGRAARSMWATGLCRPGGLGQETRHIAASVRDGVLCCMTERQGTSVTQSIGHSALDQQVHVAVFGVGPLMALRCGWVWVCAGVCGCVWVCVVCVVCAGGWGCVRVCAGGWGWVWCVRVGGGVCGVCGWVGVGAGVCGWVGVGAVCAGGWGCVWCVRVGGGVCGVCGCVRVGVGARARHYHLLRVAQVRVCVYGAVIRFDCVVFPRTKLCIAALQGPTLVAANASSCFFIFLVPFAHRPLGGGRDVP